VCHRVNELESNLAIALHQIDDQQQYGRRNTLRIHNLKCSTHDDVIPAVKQLGVTLGVDISRSEIIRAHMIGPSSNGKCQAIVKFVHYWKRSELFRNKRKLKVNVDGTFISEDLAANNMRLFKVLLSARKNGEISDAWTSDGRIFYKKDPVGPKVLVRELVRGDSDLPNASVSL
jgi:hypothetical protein